MVLSNKECLRWLKEKNLYDLALANSKYFEQVFNTCLNAKDEEVLIISDTGFENRRIAALLSGCYYFASHKLNLSTKIIFQEPKTRGEIADEFIVNSLEKIGEGIVIVNTSNKLGSLKKLGRSFRKLAIKKRFRFVSSISLGFLETNRFFSVVDSINVNYKEMAQQHALVKDILDSGKEIHVTTNAGTDLHIGIKGKKAVSADGNYSEPGRGGNLPAGEVYIAPKGKKVEGNVIIDGSSRILRDTLLIKNPINLKIERGEVTKIEGLMEAEKLKETIEWAAAHSRFPWGIKRIGEFGIGLNKKAKVIGATIIDEKAYNTAHIAIGSNYWFGGSVYAIIHLDQVFMRPKIEIDGELLNI